MADLFGVEGRPKIRRACLNSVDSTVDIQWDRPSDNCGSFTSFSIYGRSNPLSLYSFLGSYTNFNLKSQSLKLKNTGNWEFFLVYNKACNGLDSIFSDTIFIDKQAPSNSEIDSVSVDISTQRTIIGWSKNADPDVEGYYLHEALPSNPYLATTSDLFYLDNPARNPATRSVSYKIAAFDSCKNASLLSANHSTIWLQSTYNQCNKTINLTWSEYIGWEVDSYDIFLKINSDNYKKIGTVISNINQFTYNFLTFGDTYCFYVRAKKSNSNITSSSNITCKSTNNIVPSKNSYIAKASVYRGEVEVVCVVQPSSSVEKINVYRREGNTSFQLWQVYPIANSTTGETIRFVDPNVNVHSKTYSYYFTTEGPCQLQFDTSQTATTILLNVVMATPGDQLLSWTLYDKFIKPTQSQQILLSADPNFDNSSTWNILNTASNTLNSYQDFTTVSIDQQQICYCIRAIESNPANPYNRQDSSYSNIECVTADPIVYFPNAIQINGFNTIFFPKGVFLDYTQSYFQIYDRWGQIIYETNDIRKGWDGSVNGSFVQSDVYVYRAVIVGLNGKVLHFDGTLTVLK